MVDLLGLDRGGYSVTFALKNNLSRFYPCLDLRIDGVKPHDYPLPVGANASVTFKLRDHANCAPKRPYGRFTTNKKGTKSRAIRRVLTLDF